MNTKAVRFYGVNDLRLEAFELPPMKEDEILARVVTDAICLSSYKAAVQGAAHKRVPDDIAENPVIIGHEFCGEILQVGKKWAGRFNPGMKFAIQPALNYNGSLNAPGYSYRYIGGAATHIIIPNEVMEMDCLLPYKGEAFFNGSLAEPMSCIVGAFNASYHTTPGGYEHRMGIVQGGSCAILGGAGPMGLGAVDYALHGPRRPSLLVVTDIDKDRLSRARELLPPEEAAKCGIRLVYADTSAHKKPEEYLLSLNEGGGYDDVFVFAPVRSVVECGDRILGRDGCLNFFSGPMKQDFTAELNFYNVHYSSTHIVGTSGGNTDDMRDSLELMQKGVINPSFMVTHIGGLNAAARTTLDLPNIPGGKKLIYTGVNLPLIALSELEFFAQSGSFYQGLYDAVKTTGGLWNAKAEAYLLKEGARI